jgi:aspartate kinase
LSGGGDDEYRIQDSDLKGAVTELSELGTIDIVPDMAIVSLVGRQLKNMVGISGKFFSVLGENDSKSEMIERRGKDQC